MTGGFGGAKLEAYGEFQEREVLTVTSPSTATRVKLIAGIQRFAAEAERAEAQAETAKLKLRAAKADLKSVKGRPSAADVARSVLKRLESPKPAGDTRAAPADEGRPTHRKPAPRVRLKRAPSPVPAAQTDAPTASPPP
jgi:hypothetical protein